MTHFICFVQSNGRHDVYQVTMAALQVSHMYGVMFALSIMFPCLGVTESPNITRGCSCFGVKGTTPDEHAAQRWGFDPLKKTLGNSLFCVSSAPIPSGPNVAQTPTKGKSSLTVCAAVRIAMMLSVGVSLTGATHVGCRPHEGGAPRRTSSQWQGRHELHRLRWCSRR